MILAITKEMYTIALSIYQEPFPRLGRKTGNLAWSILASLDVKIEGDYLGLGVNLFSDKMTLPEMIGKEKFEKELKLFSKYYFSQFVIA